MNHDQFTLPFLDTTIVGDGFGLYGSFRSIRRATTRLQSETKTPATRAPNKSA